MECWVKFKAVTGDNLFMLERLIEMVKLTEREEGGDICGISGYGGSI